MKIAMVSEHANPLATLHEPSANGQQIHVAALAEALGRGGHRVTVYTRGTARAAKRPVVLAPGVMVEHVPAELCQKPSPEEDLPRLADFGAYLARQWALDPPAVVHAHSWTSGLSSLVGARELTLPVVQTFHALGLAPSRDARTHTSSGGVDCPSLLSSRLRLERAIGHDAAWVLAVSSTEAAELLQLGVKRRSLSVIPAGVDTERFTPYGPVASRRNRPRLLTVNALAEHHGVETIILALSRIPGAELIVAGGPARAGLGGDPEVKRLRALASGIGVADRVRFLGRVRRADLPALYRSADLVVHVPWQDSAGRVVLEAMACGRPVVASAVGGIADTVIDGVTGFLVPPRRPEQLVTATRRLLADPVMRQGYGIAGADRVRARYCWDRIAADTAAIYEQVRFA